MIPGLMQQTPLQISAIAQIDRPGMLDYLAPKVARRWLPDEVIFAPVPLTATGKVDKKRLRQTHAPAH
jgi:fatty-acyl-CoA synthase